MGGGLSSLMARILGKNGVQDPARASSVSALVWLPTCLQFPRSPTAAFSLSLSWRTRGGHVERTRGEDKWRGLHLVTVTFLRLQVPQLGPLC